MAIAFFNPISEVFHIKITNATNHDEKVEVCVNNIAEFLSIIKTCHSICKCNLEKCQVKLSIKDLESYGKKLRKSNHLLRKIFANLCEKYLTGFRHCIAISQNKHFVMKP